MRKIFTLLCALTCTLFSLAQSGAIDPTFNSSDPGLGNGDGTSAAVQTLAQQPDGKVLIGGDFTTYNGLGRNRVARLNADGSLDATFNPGTGPNGTVLAIVVQPDGKILIGGNFTTYNGIAKNYVTRLNADGSLDASFTTGTGTDNYLMSIALQSDGKILIGGNFTTYNGTARNRIARLNANGSIDAAFTPGTGANWYITSVVLQPDGKILIGGDFTSYNGTPRNFIARINANGAIDATFNPGNGADGMVQSIALQADGKVIIGGNFTSYNGTPRIRVARLTAAGALDATFSPGNGTNGSVESVAVQPDGKILIGGAFQFYNGTARNNIARLNTDATLDAAFNQGTGANSSVEKVSLLASGKILIGGSFATYNAWPKIGIARINADGSIDATFNAGTGASSWVHALAVQPDQKILIGGYFATFNNTLCNYLARLGSDGSLDATFNPGTGANGNINKLVPQPDGKILVAGAFNTFNGVTSNRLTRLNTDGTPDAAFTTGAGFNSIVTSIALQPDGKILAAGTFLLYNLTPRNRVARLNADGTLDATFNPGSGADFTVEAMCLQSDGKILIGGGFNNYNGTARARIARLNADGSLDATFNPGTGFSSTVYAISQQPDGKILIGGAFTTYNGTSVNNLTRVNSDGSIDATFNPGTGPNNQVMSIVLQPDGKILIGGYFTTSNNVSRNRLTRLNADGSPDVTFDPGTGATAYVNAIALQADGRIMIGGAFTEYNGTGRNRVARLLSTGISTGSVLGAKCANSTFGVPFTATGTFNAGNIFTAQLSNAAGSFAAPTTIGTLSGTASGTINVTLPATPNPGTGYRIRVVASDPVTTGTDNGISFSVLPRPLLSLPMNQYACNGASVPSLFLGNASLRHTWTNNRTFGLASSGTTGTLPAYTATNGGINSIVANISVQGTPESVAYVPSSATNTVTVIAPDGSVRGSIPVGTDPRGVVASPDGNRVFVTNYGSSNLSVINTYSHTVTSTVSLAANPWGIALSPDFARCYITAGANSLQVFSTSSFLFPSTITVGAQPRGVAVGMDGTRVYVANYGGGTVSVINTTTLAVIATVAVGANPEGIIVTPDGSKVLVANSGGSTVSVISTATNALIGTVTVGTSPAGIALSPGGDKAYVSNSGSANVSVIDISTLAVTATWPVAGGPRGISVSTDGSIVYVAAFTGGRLVVLDAATGTQVANPVVGNSPYALGSFAMPAGCGVLSGSFFIIVKVVPAVADPADVVTCAGSVVATPSVSGNATVYSYTNSNPAIGLPASGTSLPQDFTATNAGATAISGTVTLTPKSTAGGTAYVANSGNGTVTPVDLEANYPLTNIPVGNTPVGVAVLPDGSRAYVTNNGSASISVINTITNIVVATVATTAAPYGIALSPDGTKAYFVTPATNTLRVLNTATNTLGASIATGSNPWGLAVSPDGSRVYVANNGGNSVTVINTLTNAVVTTIPIPGAIGLKGIAVTPNGAKVYVTQNGSNKVTVIATATNTVTGTITVETAPLGICILPDGSKAYVANYNAGTVSAINTTTDLVDESFAVGSEPWGLSSNADGSTVYVTFGNGASGNLVRIFTSSNLVAGTAYVGPQPASLGNFVTQIMCTGTPQQYNITVEPQANATVSYSGSPYCNSGTGTPTFTGTTGGTFSANPAGLSINAITGAIDVAASTTGTYTVTYSLPASGSCAAYSTTAPVTVNVPVVDQPANVARCSGISGVLTSFTGSPNTVYTWTNSNTATGLAASGTGNISSFTASNVGTATNSTITVTPKIFNTDAGFAYVPNSASATVSAINLATNTITPIAVAAQPYGAVVNASGTRVYVTHNSGSNLTVINTATNSVLTTIALGGAQLSAALSPDGSRLYVTKPSLNQVAVINTATNALVQNITVGTTPWDLRVSPDGSKVYVINQGSNNVSVISTATNTVTATLPWGTTAYSLALSPDGGRLYIGNLNGQIVVVNTVVNSLVATIPSVGASAAGMVVSADGSRLFVSVNGSGVAVFNTTTFSQLSTVSLPNAGAGIMLNGDGSRVYVTNNTAGGGVYSFTSDGYTYLGLINTGNNPFGYGAWVYNPSCVGTAKQFTLTVTPTPAATLSYAGSPYCNSGTATPMFTGVAGGTYTAAPAGLSINANTGDIDVAASAAGSYTVTYTLSNSCGSVAPTAPVTISKPFADQPADVSRCSGGAGSLAGFTGSANTVYSWTNSNPATGLAASGTGNISFTAANVATTTTGTITVTPRSGIAPLMYVPNINTNRVVVVNPASGSIIASIVVGTSPQSASPLPNGTRVYVTNYGSNNVSVINTATNAVITSIAVGLGPHTVLPSPDGLKAYVSNMDGNSVSVINTATNLVSATIPGLSAPRGIGISPDGTRLYVTNSGNNTVAVINTLTNAILTNISIGAGTTPWNIAVSPDGGRVYCLNASGGGISVISTATNTVTSTITGFTPFAGIVSPDGSKLYASDNIAFNGASNIYQVNTATNAVTTIPGFNRPTGMALNYDGSMLYVTDNSPGKITTLNTATNTVVGSLSGAGQSYGYGSLVYLPYCSGTPKQFTLTVNPVPSATIMYPSTPYCTSGTATPTFTGSTGGAFTSAPAGLSVNSATGVIDVAASAAGNYTVTYTLSTGCGSIAPATSVTITRPDVDQPADITSCGGGALPAVTFSGPANTVYSWTNSNPAIGLGASGTGNIASFTAANVATPTTATITVTPRAGAGGFMYIPNRLSNNVSIINLGTGINLGNVAVGTGPFSASPLPNGTRVYVANFNSNNVSVINTPANTVGATIAVGAGPVTAVPSADGTRVYVANNTGNSVSVINVATNGVIATIAGVTTPWGMTVSPDGSRLMVCNMSTDRVTVINTATNTIITTIAVGISPRNVVFSPDGTRAYCVNNGGTISVIDVTNNTVVATVSGLAAPLGAAVSADGSKIYVSSGAAFNGLSNMSVVSAVTNTVISTIPTTGTTISMVLSQDGSVLYVVNYTNGGIMRLNTATETFLPAIPANTQSQAMGTLAYQPFCNGTPKTFTITVNPPPAASFSYAGSPYCASGMATPTFSGTTGGTYSAPAAVVINASTGVIDLAASTPGTYTISYAIAATAGCPAYSTTTSITIAAAPTVTQPADLALCAGTASTAVNFSGSAGSYTWTNNNIAVGLAASGTGNISSFTPTNATASPITATVTVTPQNNNGTGYAYVANYGASNVRVINTSTLATVATIATGNNPHSVTISPDGSRVYTANQSGNNVSVINTATNTLVTNVPTGNGPLYVGMAPDGSKAYACNFSSNTVSVINTATNTISTTINGFNAPVGMAILPDGSRGYVANFSGNTISIVNLVTNTVTGSITVGSGPVDAVLSPNGGLLYVSCNGISRVYVINTATNTVVTSVVTGVSPFGIALSPDGSRLYTANQNSNSVTVINTATNTVSATIPVGARPSAVSLNADGSRLYVANTNASTVSVIDAGNNTLLTTLTGFNQPYSLGRFVSVTQSCPGTPKTFTITVNPLPTAAISYTGSPFCASGSGTPTLTGTPGGTYSAPAAVSINATTGVIDLAASTPGTYTITYTLAAGNGCNLVQATTSVTINPIATVNQPADQTLCTGANTSAITFSGNVGGTVYNWTNSNPSIGLAASGTGNIGSFTTTNGSGNIQSATITVTPQGSCAGAPKSFTITVTPTPSANFNYSAASYCASGSTAPTLAAGTATGGVFSSTGGLSLDAATGVINLAASTPGPYLVSYTVAASGGCAQAQQGRSITITAAPNANISYGAASFCSNTGIHAVTLSGTGGGTFGATPAGLSINAGTGAIDAAASAAGAYTVSYSVAPSGGCALFNTTTPVTITAAPAAAISYAGSPYCSNGGTATVVRTGWATGTYSAAPAGVVIDAATGSVDLAGSTPGVYIVTYNASGGCTPFSTTAPITVTAVPSATIAYAAPAYCSSAGSIPVIRTGSGGGSYSASPAGLSIDAGTGAINASASVAGNYTVSYGVAAASGCALFNTTTNITITATPAASIVYSASPYCSNTGSVSPTLTGNSGGSFSSTTGLVIDAATGVINTTASVPGSYTVTYGLPASGGCGLFNTTATLTITAAPAASIAYTGSPYCASGIATVSVSGTSGGVYSAAPAGLSLNATTGAIDLAASTPGLYTVSYTIAAAGGCSVFNTTAPVTVSASQSASISYGSAPVCSNSGLLTVTRTGTGGGTFSAPAALSIDPATGSINPATSVPGTYNVTYTLAAAAGCALFSTTASVTITAAPAATIVYPGSPYCAAGSATPTITGSGGGVFSAPAGLNIAPSTGIINLGASVPASYMVTYSIPAANGCAAFSTQASVSISAAASASIAYSGSPYCSSGSSATVSLSGTGGGIFSAPAGLSIDASSGTINPALSTPGSYIVTYSIAAGGACAAFSTTASVEVSQAPTASISYPGTPYCAAGIAAATTTGTSGGSFSAAPGLALNPVTGSIDLAASVPGTYSVTYSIAAASGCGLFTTNTSVTINAAPAATIAYPSSPYCGNGGPAAVTLSGSAGGVFSAQTGLAINSSTGSIDPSASTPGSYVVSYTIAAASGCGAFSTTTPVAISAAPGAAISYGNGTFCNSGTASPVLTGSTGGVFSAAAGLSIDPATGIVNLAASTPGAYTVSYLVTAAGCAPVTASAPLNIGSGPSASIAFSAGSFCASSGLQPVNRSGTAGGVFTASPAGLSIDPLSGTVDPATSSPGSYVVSYTISASGSCPAFSTTAPVTINAQPTAGLSYSGSPFCTGGSAAPSLSGTPGGLFSAAAGLVINPATGVIDLSASTAATYTVNYSVATAGCAPATASTTVVLRTPPSATIAYPGANFCASGGPASPVLTGTTGGVFSGTAGLLIDATTGAINIAGSAPGAHTITYFVPANAGCAAFSTTAGITITPAPTASISYGGSSWCSNAGNLPATVSGTSGGTFSATPAGLSIDPVTGIVNASASSAGNYTITYMIAAGAGCSAVSVSMALSITGQPAASISFTGSPYCSNSGSALVTRTGAAGGVFSAPSGLVVDAATGTVNLAGSTPGTYLVTYTLAASGGCTPVSTTASITINAAPGASISYSAAAFCSNGGAATPTIVGTGGGTFSATPGLAINAVTGIIDPAGSTPGSYVVNYTIAAGGGCASVSTGTNVQVTAAPAASFSYAGQLCAGGAPGAPVFSGTAGGTFSASPSGLVINALSGQINASASSAGNFTVTYSIAAAGGCAAFSTTASVTVNAAPAATLSYTSPACIGTGGLLPAFAGTSGGVFSATPAGLSIDAATGAINTTGSTAGTYSVSYSIAAANGCSAFATTSLLTLNAAPSATISYAGSPFCGASGSALVTQTGSSGGIYSAAPGLVLNAATGAIDLANSAAGTYTVSYVVAAAGGCAAFNTSTSIDIRQRATVAPLGDATYCAGTFSSAINFIGTGTNYSWTNSAPSIGLAATGSGNIGSFITQNNSGSPVIATITVTPDDNGCAGTPQSFTITINPVPTATLTAPGGTLLCAGSPLALQAGGGATYQWYLDGNVVPGINASALNATATGSYSVVATLGACSAVAPSVINITPVPVPVPSFTFDGICLGNNTSFTNNTDPAGNASVTYLWNFDDGNSSALANPVHLFTQPGLFRVTLRAAAAGCASASAISSQPVRIEMPPVGRRLPAINATAGVPQLLVARPFSSAQYQWSPAALLNDPTSAAPLATLTAQTEFQVRITLSGGCEATDTLLVRVFSKNDILVPSAFTPNGDGRNDVLRPVPVGIQKLHYFRVFSRSGELVFETTDAARGWDGRHKGVLMGTATFVWIAEGTDKDGKLVQRNGTVTLIQ